MIRALSPSIYLELSLWSQLTCNISFYSSWLSLLAMSAGFVQRLSGACHQASTEDSSAILNCVTCLLQRLLLTAVDLLMILRLAPSRHRNSAKRTIYGSFSETEAHNWFWHYILVRCHHLQPVRDGMFGNEDMMEPFHFIINFLLGKLVFIENSFSIFIPEKLFTIDFIYCTPVVILPQLYALLAYISMLYFMFEIYYFRVSYS